MEKDYKVHKKSFLKFIENELDSLEIDLNSGLLRLSPKVSNTIDMLDRNWNRLQNELFDRESVKDTVGATVINLYILLLSTDWRQKDG